VLIDDEYKEEDNIDTKSEYQKTEVIDLINRSATTQLLEDSAE
jgi:hypothetical protein